MANYRFSQLANRVVPTLTSGPQVSVSAAARTPTRIIYDHDVSSHLHSTSHANEVSNKAVNGIPKNAGKAPTLEEFDPLNPGDWQLGAAGKILPRLPEGTQVGKLVMGKYGLYDPKLRKRVEAYSAGLDAGRKSEAATPFDAAMTNVAKLLAYFCLVLGFYNSAILIYGKPIWPLSDLKPAGSS